MLSLVAVLVVRFAGRAMGALGVLLALLLVWMVAGARLRALGGAVAASARLHRATLARWARPRLGAAGGALALLLIAAALVPWPVTAAGRFRAESARGMTVRAAVPGVVTEVLVREGERVPAGAALLRLTDPTPVLERAARAREADSLGALAARARGLRDEGRAGRFAREASAADARAEAARQGVVALAVRATAAGEVLSARPERLLGRRLAAGEAVLALGDPDSVEARIVLARAGAGAVRPGQRVRLVSYADVAHPREGVVASVAPIGETVRGGERAVEARVRLLRAAGWRPGVRGEARVEVARSSVLGAAWHAVRSRLRADLLL
jgi:multidrug resistance efflux pump